MQGSVRSLVLSRLARGAGAVVTYEALHAAAYGDDPDGGPLSARECLRVMIRRIRRDLPPGAVTTHHGLGYSMRPDIAAAVQLLDTRELVPR